jgi:hypothetical protein
MIERNWQSRALQGDESDASSPFVAPEGDPMFEDAVTHQLEVQITDELTMAESSRPDDPVVKSDAGWRPNSTDVKAYEARLLSLRGAVEAVEGDRTVQAQVTAESVMVADLSVHKAEGAPITPEQP